MTLTIECSLKTLRSLFETKFIRPGMSREVPGGATIKFPLPTRGTPTIPGIAFRPDLDRVRGGWRSAFPRLGSPAS